MKVMIVIILILILNVNAEIALLIDSLFIEKKIRAVDTIYSFKIHWKMCNSDTVTVKNLSRLWYIYASEVKIDSTCLNKSKKKTKIFGVGNTLIRLVACNDTILPDPIGFIESPIIDNMRFNLKRNECETGIIGADYVNIPKGKYVMMIEYNTEYQMTGNIPIWRGKINCQDTVVLID